MFTFGLGFGIGLLIYTAVMAIIGLLLLSNEHALTWIVDRVAYVCLVCEKEFSKLYKEAPDGYFTGDEDL